MDLLYGYDKRHSYMEQTDMVDFLDPNEMFHAHMVTGFPTPDDEGFENDWLNSFLDDPVLNDRMMTDAMQPPLIKSEHSYSISDNEPGSPLHLQGHEDMDSHLFSSNTALDLTMKPSSSSLGTCDTTHPDAFLSVTSTASMLSLTRQPTIIVTTSTPTAAESSSFYTSDITFPTIQIKHEPGDFLDQTHEQNVNLESIILPPTPPGSSGSDSEGSRSPQISAPSSPMGQASYRHSSSLSQVSDTTFTQPLFINPISQSGVLILSEEEKRTLVSEGYPIPTKLPLTKQEEKNLKKIRRKIKNKISAQESRRKKKEYLEALEKRVEAYNHENSDLKKKLENLENNNRSLLGQLQKLQSLVSNMPKGATQTSTALMVLVFCFAAFLGSMSPSNLNVGYYTKTPAPRFVHEGLSALRREVKVPPMIAQGDPYETPNLKSRVLMSLDQVDHCDDFRPVPWDNVMLCPVSEETSSSKNDKLPDPGVDLLGGANIPPGGKTTPDTLVVMVVSASFDNNSDTRGILADKNRHHSVMPDVMVSKEALKHGILQNMSAEKEMS